MLGLYVRPTNHDFVDQKWEFVSSCSGRGAGKRGNTVGDTWEGSSGNPLQLRLSVHCNNRVPGAQD